MRRKQKDSAHVAKTTRLKKNTIQIHVRIQFGWQVLASHLLLGFMLNQTDIEGRGAEGQLLEFESHLLLGFMFAYIDSYSS